MEKQLRIPKIEEFHYGFKYKYKLEHRNHAELGIEFIDYYAEPEKYPDCIVTSVEYLDRVFKLNMNYFELKELLDKGLIFVED